jgi:hypothetical protein
MQGIPKAEGGMLSGKFTQSGIGSSSDATKFLDSILLAEL